MTRPAVPLLDALAARTLVFDGAMGTAIHGMPLSVERDYCGCENCTDILVRSRPDIVQAIHESFLAAGADAVETNTFGANRLVLAEFGITHETYDLNRRAAEIARAACDRFATPARPRFVAGSIGPGTRLLTLAQTDWDTMLASYTEQALGLIDGGADALLIETAQDLAQVRCAVCACLDALDARRRTPDTTPILVSVTIETTGTMLLGTEIAAVATALASYPIASLGLNCATGPTEMAEHIHWLAQHWPRTISVMPNAGIPVMRDGRADFPLRPEPFADAMRRFVEHDGVGIVGGCCGTTPDHIRLLADLVHARPAPRRTVTPPRPGATSLYSVSEYRQDASIFIVGERTNSSGSRKFKELLEREDWEAMVSMAREQVRESCHALDVNVDYAGRSGPRDMGEVVARFARQVTVPLMLDSTQADTIEAGLKRAPGKCLINSANLEEGEEKFARFCHLARRYGAGLVIGTIDEDRENAMARTADRKLAIAERMVDLATRVHGLAPDDLFIDPLVLPVSTGMEPDRRNAAELVEGVRRIARELPRCQIVVGLSNVSFGLRPAARVVLNSALLHELVEAGLSAAIVHAAKILPRARIPDEQWQAALDLIYDRRDTGDPLQRFIDLFPADTAAAAKPTGPARARTLEERLRAHIVEGERQGLAETIDEARARYAPLDIINDHLLDGMKTVGELFGSGQMQLPFVLQSAEVMKAAVALLEPHMERAAGASRGTLVLATVKGDVHDIGKNLVDIILSNNGFTVHNLGIKQPLQAILDKLRETRADAVGLSGLLVKSVQVMKENLEEMAALGINVPVLLGGAALTRHYCDTELRATYTTGQAFHCRDAFEGLRAMDLIATGRAGELVAEIGERLAKRSAAEGVIARSDRATAADRARAPARNSTSPERELGVPPVTSPERKLGVSSVPPPSGLPEGVVVSASSSSGRRAGGGDAPSFDLPPSGITRDTAIPTPPFWGTRVVTGIDLDDVYQFINTTALFRGQWQFRKNALSDAEYGRLLDDTVLPVFERLKSHARDRNILRPAVVYGYFPCASEGDDLVIYDPETPSRRREIERFTFPRQAGRQRLCISDFFRPSSSPETDVVAMTCVTVGAAATEAAQALFRANDYTEYLYLHGLSVETAEALAEMWHKRIRQELGIAGEDAPRIRDLFTQHYRGSRYSFGYPACPDMSDQEKLFRLLDPARIGCTLTDNWQIVPEQSTSALIVHHPAAKYFNV